MLFILVRIAHRLQIRPSLSRKTAIAFRLKAALRLENLPLKVFLVLTDLLHSIDGDSRYTNGLTIDLLGFTVLMSRGIQFEIKAYQRVGIPIEFPFLEFVRPFGLTHGQVVVLLLGLLAVDLPLRARLRQLRLHVLEGVDQVAFDFG